MKDNLLATPDLIPARMLNEYVYCPRLFYLEYVQREWAENVDVLEGRFVHRRVDRPSGPTPSPAEVTADTKIHARSVEVGCPELGAVAVIDLLESDDGQVVPVDYKRGAVPDLPEGPGNRSAFSFVYRVFCCAPTAIAPAMGLSTTQPIKPASGWILHRLSLHGQSSFWQQRGLWLFQARYLRHWSTLTSVRVALWLAFACQMKSISCVATTRPRKPQ